MQEDNASTLSFGGRAVGMTFNPSNDPNVQTLKSAYANIIDNLNSLRAVSTDPDVTRLCSIAITEAQGAQMWAVKAITWTPVSPTPDMPATDPNAPSPATPTDATTAPADENTVGEASEASASAPDQDVDTNATLPA